MKKYIIPAMEISKTEVFEMLAASPIKLQDGEEANDGTVLDKEENDLLIWGLTD